MANKITEKHTEILHLLRSQNGVRNAENVALVKTDEKVLTLQLNFGSGYVHVGYEVVKLRKEPVMFMHCKIPKKKADVQDALTCMEVVLKNFPKIEVYYNDDLERDENNGRVYEFLTHRILHTFTVVHALNRIEQVLTEINGTDKNIFRKNRYKRTDYDQLFQNL